MNFRNVLNEIEKIDPEVFDRTNDRRHVIRNIGRVTALAAIPFALGSLFNKAYGKTTTSIVDILNFALTLEFLEAGFYAMGNTSSGLIPAGDQAAFITIGAHENEHVKFLQTTITSLSGTPAAKPTFDFTAGGKFADVFTNYDTFLAVSQTFEDTGVRAYKGQAGNLISSSTVLAAALQIHSVEARHASHVRSIRASRGATLSDGTTPLKPWITGNQSGIPGAAGTVVAANYAGEDNTMQSTVQIVGIDSSVTISANSASESFDEPLDMPTVLSLVSPFIK